MAADLLLGSLEGRRGGCLRFRRWQAGLEVLDGTREVLERVLGEPGAADGQARSSKPLMFLAFEVVCAGLLLVVNIPAAL